MATEAVGRADAPPRAAADAEARALVASAWAWMRDGERWAQGRATIPDAGGNDGAEGWGEVNAAFARAVAALDGEPPGRPPGRTGSGARACAGNPARLAGGARGASSCARNPASLAGSARRGAGRLAKERRPPAESPPRASVHSDTDTRSRMSLSLCVSILARR